MARLLKPPLLWLGLPTVWMALVLNLPMWWMRSDAVSPAPLLAEVLFMAAFTVVVLAVVGLVSRRLLRLWALGLCGVCALCAYFMARFQVSIGYAVVAATLSQDAYFSRELVGWGVLLWFLLMACLPGWWWWRACGRALTRELAPAPWSRRLGFALWAGMATTMAWALGHGLQAMEPASDDPQSQERPHPAAVLAHRYLPSNWMAGTVLWASQSWAQAKSKPPAKSPATHYTWTVAQALDDTVLVMVIGESARWDHWGLLGYPRNTTPRLAALPDVVSLRGESCNTSTQLSLACMFVRHQGVIERGLEPQQVLEDPVFSVLKHLGFEVELFALQSEVGTYNRLRPDRYKIREELVAEPYHQGRAVDDSLLVSELRRSLESRQAQGRRGPLAVILHTKGSHYLYARRYPRAFARWQPECLSTDSPCSQAQLINAYDNSILYTDHVLSELIGLLASRKALLFYASDHGESIGPRANLHGAPKFMAPPEQRAVPLLVWASKPWLAQPTQAQRFDQLRALQGQHRPHQDLFSSILGCLGVASPDGGLETGRNWCAGTETATSAAPLH